MCRSSRPEMFCKNGVLWNFAKFTGNHLCQSFSFMNVSSLRPPATLLKKRLWHRCFPVNFVKYLRTPFFTEHLRWLLLHVIIKLFSCNTSIGMTISNTFTSNARLKLAKNQALAKQHLEAELLLFENYLLSSSNIVSNNNNRYSKKYMKNNYVC